MRLLKSALVMLAALWLSACGFQLRGTETLGPELQNLYVKTSDPYGPLTRNLERYMKMSDLHLASTPADAKFVLEILSDTEHQDLISVSPTLQTRQYNLVLSVVFRITRPNGEALLPPQTISETRVFTMQANQILGGSNEETSMYQQMREDIIYAIMNRLTSQDVSTALKDIK